MFLWCCLLEMEEGKWEGKRIDTDGGKAKEGTVQAAPALLGGGSRARRGSLCPRQLHHPTSQPFGIHNHDSIPSTALHWCRRTTSM